MPLFQDKLTSKNYLLFGTIRLLAAGVLVSFSIISVYHLSFSESSKLPRVQATVIKNETHTLGNGTESEETIYTPVLQYSVDGSTYTTSKGVQATSQPYLVGQKVEIQYDPLEPSSILQPSKSRSDALQILAVAIAIPGIILFMQTLRQMIAIRLTKYKG